MVAMSFTMPMEVFRLVTPKNTTNTASGTLPILIIVRKVSDDTIMENLWVCITDIGQMASDSG